MSYNSQRVPSFAAYGGVPQDAAYGGIPTEEAYRLAREKKEQNNTLLPDNISIQPNNYTQNSNSYKTESAWGYPNNTSSPFYNKMGRPYSIGRNPYKLGTLSGLYESNNGNVLWNNCNADKTGGCSYGTYQIETKKGTMKDYLRYLNHHDTYQPFYNSLQQVGGYDAALSGTDDFKSAWKELSKNKERLEIAGIKSVELDNNSNKVKDIVNNLKTTFTNKDKYVLNKDDKDKIDKFIQQVDSTNKEYKKMQKLSITLNDVDTELQENRKKIKILTENNDALNIKVKSLEKKIDKQEDEIDDLKEKNSKLQTTINFFENLFDRLVKFIKDKMFGKEKEREDYWNFSKNLYTHGIFSDKTIESIKDDYIWNKENDKSKEKDDYEIEM
mgnify:CR=1 FL=1